MGIFLLVLLGFLVQDISLFLFSPHLFLDILYFGALPWKFLDVPQWVITRSMACWILFLHIRCMSEGSWLGLQVIVYLSQMDLYSIYSYGSKKWTSSFLFNRILPESSTLIEEFYIQLLNPLCRKFEMVLTWKCDTRV